MTAKQELLVANELIVALPKAGDEAVVDLLDRLIAAEDVGPIETALFGEWRRRILVGMTGKGVTIAPTPGPSGGAPLPNVAVDATFERETGPTRQGPPRSVDPLPRPKPPSADREVTPVEPILQRTPLQ